MVVNVWVSRWRQQKKKIATSLIVLILLLLSHFILGIMNNQSFSYDIQTVNERSHTIKPLLINKTKQMNSADSDSQELTTKRVRSVQEGVTSSPVIFVYSTDSTGAYYRDKYVNETRTLLRNLGFNVTVEDKSTIPILNTSHFINVSQFWIMNGGDGVTLTDTEKNLILDAWRNGTSLVLAGDQTGWFSNVNLIGKEFGVEYEGAYPFSNPQTPNLTTHSIWINVTTLYSDPILPQLIVYANSSAQVLSTDSGYNQHVLFENETGKVFWGNSFGNFLDEHIDKYNNSQYVSNLARYLQEPEVHLLGVENNSFINNDTLLRLQIIDDNLKNANYNWDGWINQTINEPYNIPIPLSDGWHDLNIYVQDYWNHSHHSVYSLNRILNYHSDPDWSIWYDENVNAHNVFIADNYAFVAAYNDGLVIINVTDPSNPGSAIYQSTRGTAYDVFVQDGFAYVAEAYIDGSTGGLTVVDVRDPNNPTIHGTYDWFPRVDRIFVNGNHAYLGDDEQGMLILDISDPSSPTFDSTLSIATGGIFIYNDFAYTTQISPWNASECVLAVTNITDSKNPGDPIYVNITGNIGGLFVTDSYAYINTQALGGALAIVNVTNPLNPGDPQYFNLNGYPTYIDGDGNYIYVTNNEFGTNFRLRVINVTDPQNPSSSSYYDLDGIIPLPPSEGICIDGDYLYIAHYHGLIAIDLIAAFDILPPEITLSSPINTTYFHDNVWLNISINELTSWVGYSINGRENKTIILENTLLNVLQPGTHTLQVFANDTAGNMGNSEVVTFTFLREQIILEDDFEDLDLWEITNPSIMTLNTTFGNPAPSVEIVSTQADLGLCKVEEVYFPPLESGEFIRTSIDLFIPEIQVGSISVFTDLTGAKFPFRLQVNNTNSVTLYIYSTGQESTLPYNFEPINWYEFAVDVYNDHFTLTINDTYLTSINSTAYQSQSVPIAFGDGAQSIPEQGHYFFDNIKVSKLASTSPEKELVIFKDIFDNLDNWELTVPSIFTFNTSFGNPAPSVKINSTVSGYGLCKHEEVFLPPLKSGEFIRTSIDLFIPEIQVGSISVFTDLTGVKFPFQLKVYDTANVRLYIYSGGLSSTVSYEFEPLYWYQFEVDIYSDHYSLKVNESHLTTIYSSSYQSGLVPIAFGDGDSSYEQGHYYFDNVKVSKFTDYEMKQQNPIIIISDSDFVDQGWLGSGTFQAPYLITNLEINGSGGHSIQIHNTRAHFIISDCILYGATSARMAGIFLGNVSNAQIVNNTCSGKDDKNRNYAGIWLELTNDISIINNTCQNDGYGIILWDLFGSVTNTEIIIRNNTCFNNDHGIALYSSSSNILDNNICLNNSGNGGIYLENSHSNSIFNNTCRNNSPGGIFLDKSDSNNATDNICEGNTVGILVGGSSENTVTQNECFNNTYDGIRLSDSDFNTIVNNTLKKNNNYGLYLYSGDTTSSDQNTIERNTFENNSLHNAYDDGIGNVFDYNFWSDYETTDDNEDGVGDNPYLITGGAGNSDTHPYCDNYIPSIGLETPNNNTIQSIDTIINLKIRDSNLDTVLYNWDQTLNESLTQPWNVQVPQTNGWHWFYIYVNDTSGAQRHRIFGFYIDTMAPIISITGVDNNSVNDIRARLALNISDVSLDSVWYNWDFLNNNSLLYPFNISIPSEEGEHWITVFANDSFGLFSKKVIHLWINYYPSILLSSHSNMSIISPASVLNFSINDSSLENVWYHWDTKSNMTLHSFSLLAINSSGWHTLVLYANDSWGWTTSQDYSFYILGSPLLEITHEPSIAYSGDNFICSFTVTNQESISLNLTLLAYGVDDDVLQGNGSLINLGAGESKLVELTIRPKHASIHQVLITLLYNGEIYYQYPFNFDVNPQWMSPRFYIPFSLLLFSVFLLILSFLGILAYRSRTKRERTQPFLNEEFTPISSPSFLNRIRIFFKSRLLYKQARGTLHLQTLKICRKNMKKYVGAKERQKNQLISSLQRVERQEQRALGEELSKYLVRERLTEAEGIGSVLQERIRENSRFRHIDDLHNAIRYVYGIGQVKQEGISRWVRYYKQQFPQLLQGPFPGKNRIVNQFQQQRTGIQGNISRIDNEFVRIQTFADKIKREVNWLQEIKPKHFRGVLQGKYNETERVKPYISGIFPELVSPPEWFDNTVQEFGKSQYNKILKSQYRGFISTEEWENARDEGFINKAEFDGIKKLGYQTKFDYNSAIQLGFSKATDFYTSYAVVKEEIIDKGKITDEIYRILISAHTPVKITQLSRELNVNSEIIRPIVSNILTNGKISGKIIESVYYPKDFIVHISTDILNQRSGKLSSLFKKFKIDHQILELSINHLLNSDNSIFTLYLNPDQDIFVILFNSEWNNIVRKLSSSEGFTPGTIFPELTIYNWKSIFENQKLVVLSYRDQLFTIEGLQAFTPDHLDEIDHIIKSIRRQLPQLPLTSQDHREILQTFEQLIPIEPVLLPYFCQMDSAMIVKERAALVCVECNRKICPSCFNAMRQTGMTTCIHCNGDLVERPALQIEVDIERVDQMAGHEFENFLEGLFRTQMYRVENIQSSGDYGVDLVVVKGETRTGIQAKRFKPSSKIGNQVLVTLKGGGYFHDCDKLMVVTTSYFTPKAKEYAQKVGIKLWDRDVLRRYLTKYNEHLQDMSK